MNSILAELLYARTRYRLAFQSMISIKFRYLLTDSCRPYPLSKRTRSLSELYLRFYDPLRRTMATAMGRRLEGKTVIVTGASSGIGKSTGPRSLDD